MSADILSGTERSRAQKVRRERDNWRPHMAGALRTQVRINGVFVDADDCVGPELLERWVTVIKPGRKGKTRGEARRARVAGYQARQAREAQA